MTEITNETCQTCGLCCMPPMQQDVFCDVDERDVRKLDRRFKAEHLKTFTVFERILAEMEGETPPHAAIRTRLCVPDRGLLEGRELWPCAALDGMPGVRVSCSIYASRPKTCHTAVVPGDCTCIEIRKFYGATS